MTAEITITKDRLIPQPDGSFTVRIVGAGIPDDAVLSVQRDGTIGWRPKGTNGPWEAGWLDGNKWTVRDSGYPLGAYSILVV